MPLRGLRLGSGFGEEHDLTSDPSPNNPPIQQRNALAEHFSIAMQIHGEQLAGRRMRKMGIKYSRFHPAPRR